MNRRLTALVGALLVVVAGCGSGSEPGASREPESVPATPALKSQLAVAYTNVMAISGEVLGKSQGSCETTGGKWAGIRDGAQVEVVDDSGSTVATSVLEAQDNVNAAGKICAWSASLTDIPAGGKFYRVKVGELASQIVPEAQIADGFKITD